MNSNLEYPDYRSFKPSKKKRSFFSVYLFLFGVLLGVFMTNTFKLSEKDTAKEQISNDFAEAQLFSNLNDSMFTDYEKAVIAATQRAKPAVVTIYASGIQYYRFRDPIFDMFFGPQLKEKKVMGSGVIIDSKGTIITNEHVIESAINTAESKIKVVLPDGRSFDAEIVRDLPNQDIAILSIKGKNLPYIEIGSSANISQGQTVLALGNPFGLSKGSEPTVTRGIISATKRNFTHKSEDGTEKYLRNLLQTDASINYGNSGGALIGLDGKLLGINTAIYHQGAGSIGIGFAIPADRVKIILEGVRNNKDLDDVETGIKVQRLTRNIVHSLNFHGDGGVLISEVEPGSSGDKGGFKKGDIITGIDGINVLSIEQARNMFRGAIPGEIYEMKVFRKGKYLDLNLKIVSK